MSLVKVLMISPHAINNTLIKSRLEERYNLQIDIHPDSLKPLDFNNKRYQAYLLLCGFSFDEDPLCVVNTIDSIREIERSLNIDPRNFYVVINDFYTDKLEPYKGTLGDNVFVESNILAIDLAHKLYFGNK